LVEQTTAAEALDRAVGRLLELQDEQGWWKGELETNVTMEAEDLFVREFLGIRTDDVTRLTANWIRSKQRDDGTWGNFYGAPPDLSTTIEAYAALKLAGDSPDAPHMLRAAQFVRENGGLERARVFTKMWLALFGLWSWDDLPAMPPELVFLPPWFPLNIYDFACWARQTVAALAVVSSYRPARPFPVSLDELSSGDMPSTRFVVTNVWGKAFLQLDRVLKLYGKRPPRRLRETALQRLEKWIVDRQEDDGSWGGIQPPWVWSLLALHLRGYAIEHPVMQRGFDGLDRFTIIEDDTRRLEACQSPVWDTALAAIALSDAGLSPTDPSLERAKAWLLREEVVNRGDWAIRRKHLPAGGWAFEFGNDWYPDIDDTAEVILALRRAAHDDSLEGAVQRGIAWTLGMASKNGAWGAFDADNVRRLVRRLPFCDFGEVIDPPSSDVTAHVVEMLAKEGMLDHPRLQSGVDFLLAEQEEDGSWFGRWGANYVYGTGAAVPALIAAGLEQDDPAIRHAIAWLERVQNADGGWGEDLRSYDDPSWSGRGNSTASQTAWALLALHAAGDHGGDAARRGIDFLTRTQRPDGGWDEPWYTGTGFPGDFYINYHLYRLVFPVSALGRIVHG
jgi:squalene-hopene/tetraprenyl-beta-curcumene cyclase